MTALYCPGDCRIWLNYVIPGVQSASPSNATPATVNNGTAAFLGWAEEAPEIDVQEKYVAAFADPGGNQIPTDKSWQREVGYVSFSLSKFNRAAYMAATNMPRPASALAGADPGAALRGTAQPGDVGTLLLAEGQSLVVYIQFPYSVKPAMGGGAGPPAGMEQGYRFFGATLEGFDPGPTGTKPQIVTMAYECIGLSWIGSPNAYGSLYWTTYDGNLAGLPIGSVN